MAIRKRFRVLLLAAIVAAVVVPVGFALSLESRPPAAQSLRTQTVVAAKAPAPALAPMMIGDSSPSAAIRPVMSDAAKLFFVGGILFGLAAAVRKTI